MSDERASRVILGEQLKEEREYRGFSQDEVTRYLGMPPTALSQIESGSRDISPQDLRRLAKLFRIRIETLTGQSRRQPQPSRFRCRQAPTPGFPPPIVTNCAGSRAICRR